MDVQPIIKEFEKAVVEADIAKMAECIGELHARWEMLDEATRSHVLKLEAIFLSLLNARARSL